MINPTFFSRSLKGRCHGNTIFGANRREMAYPHLYSVRWHSTTVAKNRKVDARVNTADDPSTSDKILYNF